MTSKTAILVDGGFYRRRAKHSLDPNLSPSEKADALVSYCRRHLNERHGSASYSHELYRIFYYDCPPMQNSLWHPKKLKNENFKNSPENIQLNEFFKELKKRRKVALRMGRVNEKHAGFAINPEATKDLYKEKRNLEDLNDLDFMNTARQKGVDMKIGIDIVSLALKKQVDQIVLIAGDEDFVPAAKVARREGIDFVLDPLYTKIVNENLLEHVDGVRTCENKFRYNWHENKEHERKKKEAEKQK